MARRGPKELSDVRKLRGALEHAQKALWRASLYLAADPSTRSKQFELKTLRLTNAALDHSSDVLKETRSKESHGH